MAEEDVLVGRCPQCGEEIQVPAGLEAFSCLYCGSRLTPDDLRGNLPPAEALEGDPAALLERVRRDLIGCVADHAQLRQQITRNHYNLAFQNYEVQCRAVFEDLDLACRLEPASQSLWIGQVVDDFLARREARWAQLGRAGLRRDEDKMIIAVFLVPMVGHLDLTISGAFCQTLQQKWVERYPKSPFYIGTYEDIAGGFRKKFKLCFITTAVCHELGLPDDCPQLEAFRAFRDGYLMACPDGPALVDAYYDIAPGIVACIDLCGDRAQRYAAIREDYLDPCYRDLQAGRPEACKARYVRMVRDLGGAYLGLRWKN